MIKKIAVILTVLLLFSCKSNTIFVPGEEQVKTVNLYSEYYNLAEEYVKLENYSKAIDLYKMAMNDKSIHNVAYYKLGKCYALKKDYDEAEKIFRNILKYDPDNVAIKSSLAYLTAMKGDSKKAGNIYKNLVIENPDNAELLINYISVLIIQKDYETAKINLEYLEKKFPNTEQLPKLKESLEQELNKE
ncbi:MAG: tetratricopeptide repeat protein [Treponema sp.]|uniref:tetratricopeptide repeat protein n=1 Tax=Treponema sp. TaxID=166 RepID=UPI00298DA54F|nr:tetratricopeptide repeat protein [Treponema sp.]MBR5933103.1 tetratricopeptide repeat protein [Treponema sp.]